MPKNTIIPAQGGDTAIPPVPEQSIRFDQTRGTNLRGYTPAASTDINQWTVSCWVKLTGDLTTVRTLWEARIDASNLTRLTIDATGRIHFEAIIAGTTEGQLRSSRNLRDVSGWVHIHLRFVSGSTLALSVNGYPWNNFDLIPQFFTPGAWAWMSSAAEHFIGSNGLDADNFSGQMAECICASGLNVAVTSFGSFNANGVWTRSAYAGGFGSFGFNLTFGRTLDLGEDFSGNANDFTVHTNGSSADQFADWMERNYCTLDVNDERSTGTIDDGALEVAAGNAAVTMRPDFGVWYYEVNGVATVWDTGVSGQFDPIFAGPSSLNFGQFPFVDVGPGGGELTVNSNNFPAIGTANARDYVAAIEWTGLAPDLRTIAIGDGQSTIYDIEYKDIIHRTDLVWAKKAGPPGTNWFQAHRLRPAAQVPINTVGAEETANANGLITDLDPAGGVGFEVDAGVTDNDNFNDFGNVYNCLSLHARNYAQNVQINAGDDDAEEEASGPGLGNVDTGSSDIEMVKEGGTGPFQEVGLRFNNLLIPQASTILVARMQFETDDTNTGTNDVLIFCEDIDNAPTFVDGVANFDISGRTKTTGKQAWSPADWPVIGDRTPIQRTPDMLPPVQEVIDRGGWTPGNSLAVIVVEDPAGSQVQEREAEAFGFGGNPAELQVAWRSPGAEAESGVSLFTYEGIGKARDVMHGNPSVPDLIALKNLGGNDWAVYNSAIVTAGAPEDGRLSFNNDNAYTASADWDNTAPDGTFFRVGTPNRVNEAGIEFAGFTIANLPGFSKVFRYVGNNNISGPEVYLGFKPRFVVVKRTGAAANWVTMLKVTRIISAQSNQQNLMESQGFLNTTDNFFQNIGIDAYANGFKVRDLDATVNAAGAEYVGFAFAEAAFQLAKGSP